MTATNTQDIVMEGLTIGYGEHAVVSNINATLPGGKISVILGGSGCGKSTLLKHILRLHPVLAGRIIIDGHDLSSLDRKGMHCLRQRMGVLFQDGALLGSLTLGDNVALPLREHTRLTEKDVRERVLAKLGLVGLADFYDYYPNELSGGMRKRAGLARAMVMDPPLLFCDEPTSGLDPVTAAELDQLLLELKRSFDMTMVVVSHDLHSMRAIADHVLVLGEGRVLFEGGLAALEATQDEYLRRFLDRRAASRSTPRLTMPHLGTKAMKRDCSGYRGQ
ncbi:phospholipid/cholesterol/gamma-HCH transport system ATP-binding protein [Humidesulfovibrio mexicanus]|uniref:Phospholipid/cholesterol/gamma-HCH transport system ATP-binding protein n=1 Tax=Humidesulfovibrio mexicanus TaxID=147047 RepID=A0A239AKZ8_9BACT|nr:ATP-binding cassette domain-containing protein [Humidesulfovibrio mexicanus]SNR96346.1 phospholipid/cholesterol/gamma-HCH transport system ATP-binding protein [Humidesulfovibrio mexicanus]